MPQGGSIEILPRFPGISVDLTVMHCLGLIGLNHLNHVDVYVVADKFGIGSLQAQSAS